MAKKKARMLFDVEAKLKEEFVARLCKVTDDHEIIDIENKRINFTKYLKAAIYNYLFMSNEQIAGFVHNGNLYYSQFPDFLEQYEEQRKEESIFPDSFGLGFPRMNDAFEILHRVIIFEMSEEEGRQKIEQLYWEEWLKTYDGKEYMFNLMKEGNNISVDEVKKETKDKWFK